MASRRAVTALRGVLASQPLRAATTQRTRICPSCQQRWQSGIGQKLGSDRVQFPGAVNSLFTTDMQFKRATEKDAMPTYRYIDQEGVVVDHDRKMDISDEELLKLYKDMVVVSIMDLIMFDAQRQGKISFYMVSAGEEGICVGSSSALSPRDPVFAQYREHGVYIQRGTTLDDFMAQCFSTKDDTGKGRSMPVHYGSAKHHVHAISSALATQIPHASGAAYAMKLEKLRDPNAEARVVACYFGEGAASEGDFHAALNIAATRNCPAIFICRNNGYAISTPTLEQYKGDGIASRGVGYGIDTIRVDGNDMLAMRAVTAEARALALSGDCRPVLIEAMSYRVSHHSTSDDSFAYRAKVEVEDWKRRDNPITRLRKYMETTRGIWDEEKEKELRSSSRKEVLDAYRKAENAKKPPLASVMTDVYKELTEEQVEQLKNLRSMIERYPDEYDTSEYEGGAESLKI